MKRFITFLLLAALLIGASDLARATITANDRRVGPSTLSGAQTTIAYDFKIFSASDLYVAYYTLATTTWAVRTLNVHYTVTGVGSGLGGNVVLVTPAAAGDKILILGNTPASQSIDWNVGDKIPPTTLEDNGLDRLTTYIQQDRERIGRSAGFPSYSTKSGILFDDFGAADDGYGVCWDNDQTRFYACTLASTNLTISAFANTLLDDANAAAMRTTLGVADPATFLLLSGGNMTGNVDFDGHTLTDVAITSLAAPAAGSDAATKTYVDNAVSAGGLNPFATVNISDDFITVSVIDNSGGSGGIDSFFSELGWQSSTNTGGSGVAAAQIEPSYSNSGNPGVLRLSSGTGTVSWGAITSDAPTVLLGGGALTVEWLVRIEDLADATEDYEIACGLGDDATDKNPPNGVYFKYDRDTSANWYIFTSDNNSDSSVDSTVAVTADAWIRLKITTDAAATTATYYINGTSVGTRAGLPTALGRAVMPQCGIYKENGTTARLMYVDLFSMTQILTTPR